MRVQLPGPSQIFLTIPALCHQFARAGLQVDAKQRQLIWPGAKRTARKERLDLDQSVQRIQKTCPEFPGGEIEEFLLDWIDMGYDPENYSQAQLDELDKLTERWVADHR